MRVECALLCDAASVRENLLHVLGGGITDTTFARLPGPLAITYALRAVLESRELQRTEHHLRLRLTDFAGEQVGNATLTFTMQDPARVGEEASVSVAVPLTPFVIERAGRYLLEASLDHQALPTLPLRVAVQGPAPDA